MFTLLNFQLKHEKQHTQEQFSDAFSADRQRKNHSNLCCMHFLKLQRSINKIPQLFSGIANVNVNSRSGLTGELSSKVEFNHGSLRISPMGEITRIYQINSSRVYVLRFVFRLLEFDFSSLHSFSGCFKLDLNPKVALNFILILQSRQNGGKSVSENYVRR